MSDAKILHTSPGLVVAVGRVLAEVDRIETQTGRRPRSAFVGPDDLAGLDEVTYDGIQIRTSNAVVAGDIYLLVSQK